MKSVVRTRLLASTLLVGAAALANPAFAQRAGDGANQPGANAQGEVGMTTSEATPSEENSQGDIVVTGSLISNPNLIASAPVTVVGQEEIQLRQSNTAESILRELPGVVPSIGSAVNNGNGGSSFVDLRGLGSFRNVVLLDGTRIVPADLVGRVDLNNIPLALVERVDALTGGAATTYGADAVSGVVNFITRSDFAGVDASASEQITERGDGNYFRADVTIGANFDDGKGNAVFSIGYQQADPVYQGARDYSFFNINGATAAPAAAGSGTATPSSFTRTGSPTQQIDPASGLLVPVYAPFNFNPFNIFQTPFKRYNMYGAAHYDISDNIQVYTRGVFSKNQVSTILAAGGSFGESITVNYNNPFLPAGAASQFGAAQGLTPAQITAARAATGPTDPNFRTFTTNVSRRTTELGTRNSTFTTQFFDYRAGVKIGLTDSLSLDVSGAYGESERNQAGTGNLRASRLRQAALTSNGTTCLSGVAGAATPEAGCIPVNLFGADGTITPTSAAFLTTTTSVLTRSSLAQGRAILSGDFGASSPFASDPIGFAVGGEYRKYNASQASDVLSQTPGEISGSGGAAPNITGGFEITEGYGELIAPLVQDKPFFQSLTLEAGVRYSHYTIFAPARPTFNTTTYKAGGSWEPVDGIKFRGNYQRAVRAPSISELFSPVQTSLVSLATDPCSSINSAGTRLSPAPTGNLLAVCLAQGATAANVSLITPPTAGQANSTQGGNVNLRPEKSNSYTFGVVLQPKRFIPGLSVTVDYYNIKISGAIGAPTTDDALRGCFGGTTAATANVTAASASSVACTSIRRNPVTGGLDGSAATTPGVLLASTNLGRLKTDGIDVGVNYRRDFGDVDLALSFQGNYTHDSKFQAVTGSPTSLFRECTGFYSASCASIQPKFYSNTRATLTFFDNIDISVLWRRINKVKYEPASGTIFSGVVPVQQGGALNPFSGDTVNFGRVPTINYFDLAGRFGVSENFDLTVTVNNLLDKQPPITGSNIGDTAYNSGNTYPSTYDTLGRRFAVGGRLKF